MRSEIERLLRERGGVASRSELMAATSRSYFDHQVDRGLLIAVFPRAYCFAWDADLPEVRDRAALVSVGGEAALSHLTALHRWGLPAPEDAPLHVTAFNPRHPRGVPGQLTVHRTLLPLRAGECGGLPVVRPAVAAVTSWPLQTGSAARAPVIEATRRRLVTRAQWEAAVLSAYRMPGIAALRRLIQAVVAGCESELELYGYLSVFDVPGLRHARRQVPITVGGERYRLDMYYEDEQVAVELDGRAYHSGPGQRERDAARDLIVARAGVQTIRLSHQQLTYETDHVRRAVLEVLSIRRRQRGLAS